MKRRKNKWLIGAASALGGAVLLGTAGWFGSWVPDAIRQHANQAQERKVRTQTEADCVPEIQSNIIKLAAGYNDLTAENRHQMWQIWGLSNRVVQMELKIGQRAVQLEVKETP